MKPKTYIIRSKEIILRLNTFLLSQPKEPTLEVIVRDHKKDRSLAQNSLMWMWITVVSNELGWTKNDVHEHFKKCHLVKIYERDNDGYSAMINAVRRVYSGGAKGDATAMFEHIVKLTSTTSATVKQFTEYLNDIEKDMTGKGIILPHPEDLYNNSMGR